MLCLPAEAQTGTVEDIIVQGLSRMSREGFDHVMTRQLGAVPGIKVGDAYDPKLLSARFKHLWSRGLFEDITIETEPGERGGVVLIIKIEERPTLTSVTYDDSSVMTKTEIEDRLKERELTLKLNSPLDLGSVYFAEAAVRDLLSEKGFLDATVDATVRKITETTRAVHFTISSGGKTRIQKIEFEGNELFKDKQLKSRLRLTQERRWWWPWSQKNLYHPAKWDQDVSGVTDMYLHKGYLDVEIRPPVIEVRDADPKKEKKQKAAADKRDAEIARLEAFASSPIPSEIPPKKQEKEAAKRRKARDKSLSLAQHKEKAKRWVYLTVPVKEGEPYTLGDVTIAGNDLLSEDILRPYLTMGEGDTLSSLRLDSGVDRITSLYEDLGHLYANVIRRVQRREGEHVADVEIVIEEDLAHNIARIEFTGNSATHDRVLRREVLLAEGERFSRSRLNFSRRKVNQLGYFQVPTEPVVEPLEGEQAIGVTLVGQEQGRNEIQIGGGYSGVDGAFFNGVYSTRNFMGRGQVLSTAVQVGGRSNRYQISFQEPWFLGRPLRLGFSIFRRDVDYGSSLSSTSDGGGVLIGKRFGRSTSFNLGYNWEAVTSRTVLSAAGNSGQVATVIETENRVSSITPAFSFNTINNPYRPSAGKQLSLSMQIAGGALGGDTNFLKPVLQATFYRRGPRRSFFGIHGQLGMVTDWAGGSDFVGSSDIEGVPRYQRFWLGGDTLGPRIFETRSITPLRYVELSEDGTQIVNVLGDPRYDSPDDFATSGGTPVLIEVGGDRFFLLQTEYVVPLNEQAEVALFLDAGDALFEDRSFNLDTTRVSAGVEVRFHLPIFPVPLRLIYGWPVREVEGDDTASFTFSIGRSF
ncbi:MAG: BamA/TamA family outer membrane protein [bacterium]|nr:BamA/TamA family outer membrane protein [bacterium]